MVSPLSDPRHKFCHVCHFISPSVISSVGIVNCEERKKRVILKRDWSRPFHFYFYRLTIFYHRSLSSVVWIQIIKWCLNVVMGCAIESRIQFSNWISGFLNVMIDEKKLGWFFETLIQAFTDLRRHHDDGADRRKPVSMFEKAAQSLTWIYSSRCHDAVRGQHQRSKLKWRQGHLGTWTLVTL